MTAKVSKLPTAKTAAASTPVWMSPTQVAERVPGMTVRNLEMLRGKGRGPTYFKPTPQVVLYEQTAVDDWVAAAAVKPRETD